MENPIAEGAASAVEMLASNPKVATAVSAAAAAAGTTAILNYIQTSLGILSLVLGCAIACYVLRINAKKLQIYQRMLENGESLKE
jgi:hypothetical protein